MTRKFLTRIFGIALALLLALWSLDASAQLRTNVYLSPRLKIGWTFYSGFNYGLELNIGLFNMKAENPQIDISLAPQYMLVNYKGNTHSLISINAVLESDYYRLMLGMGEALTKWGFHGRNSNRAFGYNVAMALSTSSKYTPWVEGQGFVLKNGYWEFYGRPYYLSVSTFFRPDPYIVYETN